MISSASITARDVITLSRDIDVAGERAVLYSRVKRGELVALFRGVYVDAVAWGRSSQDERYLLRVHAASCYMRDDELLSHWSAAGLWRLPSIASWPTRAHVRGPVRDGGRSSAMFARHENAVLHAGEHLDGLPVTTLACTVVDMAAVAPFPAAVAMADAALRRTGHPSPLAPATTLTRAVLRAEAERVPVRRGSARIRRVIEFADGRADRAGESVSRASIHLAGLPAPELQVPMRGASGRNYTVDFWWPRFSLIGEFDGQTKYRDPEFLNGRTPQQAVYDEKLREDDLRATGKGMSRWPWEVAVSPPRLRAHLAAAGIR